MDSEDSNKYDSSKVFKLKSTEEIIKEFEDRERYLANNSLMRLVKNKPLVGGLKMPWAEQILKRNWDEKDDDIFQEPMNYENKSQLMEILKSRNPKKNNSDQDGFNLDETTLEEKEILKKLSYPKAHIPTNKNPNISKKEGNGKNVSEYSVKIPDIKLETSNDFFENLVEKEKLFVIHKGTLYFPGSPVSSGKGSMKYKNLEFILEQSEDMSLFEKEYCNKNKKEIERFKSNLLKKLSEEESNLDKLYKDFSSSNGYSSREEELLDTIINYGYTSFKNITKNKPSKTKEEKVDLDSIKKFMPDISGEGFMRALKKAAEKINKKDINTLVGVLGNLYAIDCGDKLSININEINNFYRVDKNYFKEEYNKILQEEIKSKIKTSISKLLKNLSVKKEEVESLRNLNKAESSFNSSIKKRKIEDGYIIFREIPDFIINRDGNYSLFDGAKLATIIHFNKDNVKIEYPGFILDNKNYIHLFSIGSNEYGTKICHGSAAGSLPGVDQSWQKIDSSSKFEIADQVHTVINKLEQIITTGCSGNYLAARPGALLDKRISEEKLNNLKQGNIKIYNN